MPERPHQRVLVVIPAWNDSGVIVSTIAEIRAARPDVDILVVDDGSGDDTADRAEAAGALVALLAGCAGIAPGMTRAQVIEAWGPPTRSVPVPIRRTVPMAAVHAVRSAAAVVAAAAVVERAPRANRPPA